MQSYLSDRTLFVVANGDSSSHMSIQSGVPQGAIWSPLLFDLFIRNVPQRELGRLYASSTQMNSPSRRM
ncbi:unnamed protein product [Heterosigma akashiwo]